MRYLEILGDIWDCRPEFYCDQRRIRDNLVPETETVISTRDPKEGWCLTIARFLGAPLMLVLEAYGSESDSWEREIPYQTEIRLEPGSKSVKLLFAAGAGPFDPPRLEVEGCGSSVSHRPDPQRYLRACWKKIQTVVFASVWLMAALAVLMLSFAADMNWVLWMMLAVLELGLAAVNVYAVVLLRRKCRQMIQEFQRFLLQGESMSS